jgi:hypothetical protein
MVALRNHLASVSDLGIALRRSSDYRRGSSDYRRDHNCGIDERLRALLFE